VSFDNVFWQSCCQQQKKPERPNALGLLMRDSQETRERAETYRRFFFADFFFAAFRFFAMGHSYLRKALLGYRKVQ
jgi:hypothetical protein